MKEWLITPYRRNARDPAEIAFNVAHKRTRRLVENAYGIVKERFPCLNHMRLQPEKAGRIVMAAAALHNVTTTDDFMLRELRNTNDDNDDEEVLSNNQNAARNARLQELLDYFRQ